MLLAVMNSTAEAVSRRIRVVRCLAMRIRVNATRLSAQTTKAYS